MVNCRFISVFLILLLLYVYIYIQLVARGPARRDVSFHYIKRMFDYIYNKLHDFTVHFWHSHH